MDLTAINSRLTERRIATLANAVAHIEAGIEAGEIPNKTFEDAKFIIGRAIEEAVSAYETTASDRWGETYSTIVSGAYNLASGIKDAKKHKNDKRAEFLSTLLPLSEILAAAKPLIVKRGDKPKVVTPKQAVKLAKSMTCQCCGRSIFAETGLIAHHGYERPGGGWQTASCSGARELPFEVSRDALRSLIENLKDWKERAILALADVELERTPIIVELPDYTAPRDRLGERPSKRVEVTRATFDAIRAENEKGFTTYRLHSFEAVKADNVAKREREISGVRSEIKAQQARFDGWKQTHEWRNGKWGAL